MTHLVLQETGALDTVAASARVRPLKLRSGSEGDAVASEA